MKRFKAIAAMAENRVIGAGNRIPWHLPEDFAWFKRTTMGGLLVMGRKTFESIGRPLPGRETVVVSRRGFSHPGVRTVPDLAALDALVAGDPRPVWICGGADLYRQLLPECAELYLTRVQGRFEGDAFFPPFEQDFTELGEVLHQPAFRVVHYVNRRLLLAGAPGPGPGPLA